MNRKKSCAWKDSSTSVGIDMAIPPLTLQFLLAIPRIDFIAANCSLDRYLYRGLVLRDTNTNTVCNASFLPSP